MQRVQGMQLQPALESGQLLVVELPQLPRRSSEPGTAPLQHLVMQLHQAVQRAASGGTAVVTLLIDSVMVSGGTAVARSTR
jgi:hypothetical protein